MLRILIFANDNSVQTLETLENIQSQLQSARASGALLWVDMTTDSARQNEAVLLNAFGFHPLALEDAFSEANGPKLDDWENYYYLVLETISSAQPEDLTHTQEVDVFVSANLLVTIHEVASSMPVLDDLWASLQRNPRQLKVRPNHLLYLFSKNLLNGQQKILNLVESTLERLESYVLDTPDRDIFHQVLELKQNLLHLRDLFDAQRDVFSRLSQESILLVEKRDRPYFRDMFDFASRLNTQANLLREQAAHTIDIYLASLNNRMNDSMRFMAVITTLFMPLTFITGFFGMNFFQPMLPAHPWTSEVVLGLTIIGLFVFPAFMWWWLKKRGLF